MIRWLVVATLAWHWAHDPWWGRDKAQHLAGTYLVASAVDLGLRQQTDGKSRRAWSVGLSLSIGIAKELYDALRPRGSGFSWKDLAADATGALLAGVFH